MPLRQDLLTPIAGDNPAGISLRYEPVYDQIKEARTEEDETLPTGAWARTIKRADLNLVINLAGEALANKSKDLQLAVWLGEAICRQEGFSVLPSVLKLCLELQQRFWEALYPEMDDGDPGLRVAPLQWSANRYTPLVYGIELTSSGIDFFEYKAARAAGREAESNNNEQQRTLRKDLIDKGRPTSEAIDDAITSTPKSFYIQLEEALHSAKEVLRELEIFCDEHYGEDGPSFRKLREAIEEIQNLASSLLREKRRLEPDPIPDPIEDPIEDQIEDQIEDKSANSIENQVGVPDEEDHGELTLASQNTADPPQISSISIEPDLPPKAAVQTVELESWSDALIRIESAVSYMYEQDPSSPVPFLLRSSMRVAELRVIVTELRYEDLAAAPTELRQSIKGAVNLGNWMEVHRQSFEALGTPSGCGWLDLYRHLWTSCRESGWEAQQRSIVGVVSQILREMPELPGWTLNDDTPVANADTLRWLEEEIAPPPITGGQGDDGLATASDTAPVPAPALVAKIECSAPPDEEDVYVTAQALTAKGQIQGAIQMLASDAAHQSIGRLRYGRNLQIAELCVQSGNKAIAIPLLQSLVREVEERKLESWEPSGNVARPYALLLQCAPMAKLDTQFIFARLCAIDPCAALSITPPVEG